MLIKEIQNPIYVPKYCRHFCEVNETLLNLNITKAI